MAEIEESRDPETGQVTARVHRDYRALIPLLRHRYEPDNPQVRAILEKPRDVHMSIDAALQMRASEILAGISRSSGNRKARSWFWIPRPAIFSPPSVIRFLRKSSLQISRAVRNRRCPMPT